MIMNTTKRFDESVTKLYNAFNNGDLNAGVCSKCAVGNLLSEREKHFWKMHSTFGESYKGTIDYKAPKHKDYTEDELYNIEEIFLKCFNVPKRVSFFNKEAQFNGLMAVINYLAELDNIKVPKVTTDMFKEVLMEI